MDADFWKSRYLAALSRAKDAEQLLAELVQAHDDSLPIDTDEEIEHALGHVDYEKMKRVLIQDRDKNRISITEARKPKVA